MSRPAHQLSSNAWTKARTQESVAVVAPHLRCAAPIKRMSRQALTGHVPSVEEGVVHTFGCEDLTYSLEASDRAPLSRSFEGDVNGSSGSLAYPCPFRGCSTFGGRWVSCRRACGVAAARPSVSQRVDGDVEHRQIRDGCRGRIRKGIDPPEDHRRSHVQDPRAREPLSEGNAGARIWRAHSFHHLQADRP